MFWFRVQGRRLPIAVGLLAVAPLLAYGGLVRTNAVFGLGPLLLYALAPASWLRASRLIMGSVIIAALAIPLSQLANRHAFHAKPEYASQSLMLFDLMGIAVHADDPSLLEPRGTITRDDFIRCYTPYLWDALSDWGRCADKINRNLDDPSAIVNGLTAQWARTIAAHPVAYTKHRLKYFNSSVFFAVPLKHIRFTPEFDATRAGIPPLAVITDQEVRLEIVRKNPFFWPVSWLVWSAGVLVFLRRAEPLPAVHAARVLIVSALGYSSAYLLIGVATDMRYQFWSLMAMVLASVMVLPQLVAGMRARNGSLRATMWVVGLVMLIGLVTRLTEYRGFL
jgi:hypothetical protein